MGYLHQLLLLPPTPAATHWVCLRHGSKQSSEVLLLAGRIFDGCTTPRVGNARVRLRHNTAAGCGIRQMQALNNPIHLYFGSTFCWKRETLSFTNRIIMVKKRKKKKRKYEITHKWIKCLTPTSGALQTRHVQSCYLLFSAARMLNTGYL